MTVREFCLRAIRRRELRFRIQLGWIVYVVLMWWPVAIGVYHYYGGFDGAPLWIAIPSHTAIFAFMLAALLIGHGWLRGWARRNGLACPSCKRVIARQEMNILTGTGDCPFCGFQLLEDHKDARHNPAQPSDGRAEMGPK